jgi:hypothetical protein
MAQGKIPYKEVNDFKNGKNSRTNKKFKGPAAGKNQMDKNKKKM